MGFDSGRCERETPPVFVLLPPSDQRLIPLLVVRAGNLTLIGSIANLIVAEKAAATGHELSFWIHLRFGTIARHAGHNHLGL